MTSVARLLRTRAGRLRRRLQAPGPQARRQHLWDGLASECDLVTITRDGLRWTVPVGDAVGRDLFVTGHYQAREIAAIQDWLASSGRAARTVVDVGANIGTTSIPFARTGWNVVAIEPVPATVELLRGNVVTNHLEDRIRIVPAAVSDDDGAVDMVLDGDLGHSEVVPAGGAPGFGDDIRSTVAVRAAPLTTVLREAEVDVDDVAVVWSDTQGHEAHVLSTGTELWRAGVPCFVEVWPRGLRAHGAYDRFNQVAEQQFTTFVARDQLLQQGASAPRRPITELAAVVRATEERPPGRYGRYTDVLLIP